MLISIKLELDLENNLNILASHALNPEEVKMIYFKVFEKKIYANIVSSTNGEKSTIVRCGIPIEFKIVFNDLSNIIVFASEFYKNIKFPNIKDCLDSVVKMEAIDIAYQESLGMCDQIKNIIVRAINKKQSITVYIGENFDITSYEQRLD